VCPALPWSGESGLPLLVVFPRRPGLRGQFVCRASPRGLFHVVIGEGSCKSQAPTGTETTAALCLPDLPDIDFLPVDAVIGVADYMTLGVTGKSEGCKIALFEEERVETGRQIFQRPLRL